MHATDPSVARSRRRRLPRLGVCVALSLACSGVAVAQASAATLTVGQACVVNPDPTTGSPMTVTGQGFTPGGPVSLASNKGGAFGNATADASGNISLSMTGPTLPSLGPAAASFVLTATDETSGGTATTAFDAANLAVATNPLEAKPSKRVTWTFSGFTSGAEIYAHYLHKGKVAATTKFGRAQGACGTLRKKAVFYPGKAKYSSYKVQVDDSRHYAAGTLPRWVATLKTHLHL
jgi:hypothetical protein